LLPTLLDGQNEITNSIMVLSPKATTAISHYIILFLFLFFLNLKIVSQHKGLLDANKNGHWNEKKRTWYIDVTFNMLISMTLSLEAQEIESLSLAKDPRYFKFYLKLWKVIATTLIVRIVSFKSLGDKFIYLCYLFIYVIIVVMLIVNNAKCK
jgi:hypothetical protein